MSLDIKNGIIQGSSINGVPFRRRIVQFSSRKHRTGKPMANYKYVVMHNTGNDNRSADANMHATWLQNLERNPQPNQVGMHFTVDDKEIIQLIPINEIAYCQGDGSGPGNSYGVSVEVCQNNKSTYAKAEENGIKLIAALLAHNKSAVLRKHQDFSGKYCPMMVLRENRWTSFAKQVADEKAKVERGSSLPNLDTLYRVRIYSGMRDNDQVNKILAELNKLQAYKVYTNGMYEIFIGAYGVLDNAIAKAQEALNFKLSAQILQGGKLIKEYLYSDEKFVEKDETLVPIIGAPTCSLEQMMDWADLKKANPGFKELAPIYYEMGKRKGIDPCVAYAQFGKETGFLYKWGSSAGLDASFKNPCGLKTAVGGPDDSAQAHMRFETWEQGIEAQFDHLALYAGARGYPKYNESSKVITLREKRPYDEVAIKRNGETPDPRHFPRLLGTAKEVEALGTRWAPSKDYGKSIVTMMKEIRSIQVVEAPLPVEEMDPADKPWIITAHTDVDFKIASVVSDMLRLPLISLSSTTPSELSESHRLIHIGANPPSESSLIVRGANRMETLRDAMVLIDIFPNADKFKNHD